MFLYFCIMKHIKKQSRTRLCYIEQSTFQQLIPHNKLWGDISVYKENDINYYSLFSNSEKSDNQWILNEDTKKDLFSRIEKVFDLYKEKHLDNNVVLIWVGYNPVNEYIVQLAKKNNFECVKWLRSTIVHYIYNYIDWDKSLCVEKFGPDVIENVLEPLLDEMDENEEFIDYGPIDIQLIKDIELRKAFVLDLERFSVHEHSYDKNILVADGSIVLGQSVDWLCETIKREHMIRSLNVITMCPATDINVFES